MPRPRSYLRSGETAEPPASVACEVANCRARTSRGKKCARHSREIDGLEVKASTIPGAGLGLFAACDIPHSNGKMGVAEYAGRLLTREELNEKYPDPTKNAEYALQVDVHGKWFIDAESPTSCLGRFVNHASGTGSNVVFWVDPRRKRAGLRTKRGRNIAAGDEILVNYGPSYKKDDFLDNSRQ